MGQLLGVFGRFKAGKTVTAATIASNLERRGIQTLVVSLERRKHDVERFLVARSLGIDARDLDLKSDKDQKAQFAHYLEETRNLRYVHRPAISIEQLRTRIIAAVRAHGTRIVIVDYWQLITNKDSRQSQADKQQDAAQMLADIAATLDIGIVVMGQINQQGEPRGGEGILASAGIVIYIERPNMGDEGFIKAVVCNKGPVRNSGGPEEPSITLTQPGPHFTDMLSES
jgi:replicative DNA helicase